MGCHLSTHHQCSAEDLHDVADLLRVSRSPFDDDAVLAARIDKLLRDYQIRSHRLAYTARLLDPNEAADKLKHMNTYWSSIRRSLKGRTKARRAGHAIRSVAGHERLLPPIDVSSTCCNTMEAVAMAVGCVESIDSVDDRTKFDFISDMEWYIERGEKPSEKVVEFPSDLTFLRCAARALSVRSDLGGCDRRTKTMMIDDIVEAMYARTSDGTSVRELAKRPTLEVFYTAEYYGLDLEFIAWLRSVRATPADNGSKDKWQEGETKRHVSAAVHDFRKSMAETCKAPDDVKRAIIETGDTKLILPYLTGDNVRALVDECSVRFPFVHPHVVLRRHLVDFTMRLPWHGDSPGMIKLDAQLGTTPLRFEGIYEQWRRILSAVAKNPKSFAPSLEHGMSRRRFFPWFVLCVLPASSHHAKKAVAVRFVPTTLAA